MYQKYRASLIIPLRLTFIMWVLFCIQFFLGIDFSFLGIKPRTSFGLIGIITSPLVHGNANHILSNSLPFVILSASIFIFYNGISKWIFFSCYFLTSALVWLLGRGEFHHIGASGVIYALAFFLIFFGFFRKDFRSLLVSILIVALYGGLMYGVFPSRPGISWESHALGALVGASLAFVYRKTKKLD